MSTKIFNAYKLKVAHDPWDTIWGLQERGVVEVTKSLKKAYWDAMCEVSLKDEKYIKVLEQFNEVDWEARLYLVHNTFRKGFEASEASPYRDSYDLNVSVSIYPHKGGFYLIAHCDPVSLIGKSLQFLESDPRVVDFHYQNQVDKPSEVSDVEWAHREATWDEVLKHSKRFVTLDICSKHSYVYFQHKNELYAEYKREPPTFPSYEAVRCRRLEAKGFEVLSVTETKIEASKNEVLYVLTKQDNGAWEVPGSDPFPELSDAIHQVIYLGMDPEEQQMMKKLYTRYQDA